MGPLYLGKMGTFVNFRYINNLAFRRPYTDHLEVANLRSNSEELGFANITDLFL